MAPWLRASTRNILLVLAMKLLLKVSEYQFGTLSPLNFEQEPNGTACRLRGAMPDFATENTTPITWLYSSRAVLPVLGGLLADAYLGYALTLNSGGIILLLSTILLSVAVYCDLICQPGSALVVITWLLVVVQYGVLQPSIFYGLYRWHFREPRTWPLLTGAYYSSLKLGGCVALLLPQLQNSLGRGYSLICAGSSAVFIGLSCCLTRHWRPGQFRVPTVARLIAYSKIFTFMALFSVSIADTQSTVYSAEIRYYMSALDKGGGEVPDASHSKLQSPEMIKLVTQVVWGLVLMVAARVWPGRLPMEPRLYGGILLEASVTAALLVVVAFAPPRSVAAVDAVYWTACTLDGAAEILTVSAGYEIMLGVAQRQSRILVFGMCFTIWGLANLVGRGLVKLLSESPADNPALKPSAGRQPLFFVYHLIILALLGTSITHYWYSGRHIVTMLFMTEVEEDADELDEASPLFDPVASATVGAGTRDSGVAGSSNL